MAQDHQPHHAQIDERKAFLICVADLEYLQQLQHPQRQNKRNLQN